MRIVTLSDFRKGMSKTPQLLNLTEQLRFGEIDVLCYQGMYQILDSMQDPVRKIAESLHMTYSFSAFSNSLGTRAGCNEQLISGLLILAGSQVWMLNSGSFSLPGEETAKNQVAQFAVLRQNGKSVLIINAELSPVAAIQLQQLHAVFSHHLLQKEYDAVVLCANRYPDISSRELRDITALSAYNLANEAKVPAASGHDVADAVSSRDQSDQEPAIDGVIFTLTARMTAQNAVRIQSVPNAFLLDCTLVTEFEFQHICYKNKNKLCFPLSFSEQATNADLATGRLPAAFGDGSGTDGPVKRTRGASVRHRHTMSA